MHITFGWHLDGDSFPPTARGMSALGEPVVGPLQLLDLLETRLGLSEPRVPAALRIARYQTRLREIDDGTKFYSDSLEQDAWATAKHLLGWRDALVSAGWDGRPVPDGGPRLDTLATAEAINAAALGPATGDRLSALIATIETERLSGVASVSLATSYATLPKRWQVLLDHLAAADIPVTEDVPTPRPVDSDLGQLQAAIQGEPSDRLKGDGSFVVVSAGDVWQAADALADWMAASDDNSDTVLLRRTGLPVLDKAFQRKGLPRPGWQERSAQRGALQVLPLALQVRWAPLDTQRLLEFLVLPHAPLPGYVRRHFANALMEAPGIGGKPWKKAWEAAKAHKAERLREDGQTEETRIRAEVEEAASEWAFWLEPELADRGYGIPATTVQAVCRRLAQWAAGTAENDDLFRLAAAHASTLAEAIGALDADHLSEVQLGRMVDAVTAEGQTAPGGHGEAASWHVLDHPGRLWRSVGTVVWWNPRRSEVPMFDPTPWTASETAALRANGIAIESSDEWITREAAGWRAAVVNAGKRLILVRPEQENGESVAPHPLWHEIAAHAERLGGLAQVRVQAEALSRQAEVKVASRQIRRMERASRPIPEAHRTWAISADTVRRRDTESISSIGGLLGCPFAWAVQYGAGVKAGRLAVVPDLNTLMGTLAHAVVEELLTSETDWQPDAAADRAAAIFDARAPQLAAPICQPGAAVSYRRARAAVREAMRMLVGEITAAGLHVRATEGYVTGTFRSGQKLQGYLDLVLSDAHKRSIILDLKWSRSDRYRAQEIRENRALQLAGYTALEESNGRHVAGAGYFMLGQQRLLFTEPVPFGESHHVAGTSLHSLWDTIVNAYSEHIQAVEAGRLTARGVETDDDPPEEEPNPTPAFEAPCRFCDYGVLCGRSLMGATS